MLTGRPEAPESVRRAGAAADGDPVDPARLRAVLEAVARDRETRSYQQVAQAVGLHGPRTIQRLAVALEGLMREDARAGRPLLAAVVVSRTGTGLPAAGFFDEAARLGRFDPGAGARADFHALELARVHDEYERSAT